MKKSLTILIIIIMVMLFIPSFGGCTPRDEELKICNWEDYIAPNVIEDFEAYYQEITGKPIKVTYDSQDTNEQMLNSIAIGRTDYDLICPSDYMIEKMRKENLLLTIDKELGNDVNDNPIPNYLDSASAFTKSRDFDPTNEYAIGYMWGTLGILYNTTLITNPTDADSWAGLWNSNYNDKIYMKDSVRDSFAIAALYANRNALASARATMSSEEYNIELTNIINDTTAAGIDLVKNTLITQKSILKGYEVDYGKQDMIDGTATMALQWSGDAVYSISMEPTLAYSIPEEGSNIFFDGWVIPKYAGNKKAAELFMNFLCLPEIAIANMDYIGYTSTVSCDEIIDYLNENYADYDTMDLSYFFGEGALSVHADPNMYPSSDAISRLAVMRDFGTADGAIIEMWNTVKASN